jgi:hypothetical protein
VKAKLSKLLKQDDETQFPEAYQVVITTKKSEWRHRAEESLRDMARSMKVPLVPNMSKAHRHYLQWRVGYYRLRPRALIQGSDPLFDEIPRIRPREAYHPTQLGVRRYGTDGSKAS